MLLQTGIKLTKLFLKTLDSGLEFHCLDSVTRETLYNLLDSWRMVICFRLVEHTWLCTCEVAPVRWHLWEDQQREEDPL